MKKASNPNLDILLLAVDQLSDLADEFVFLGGCATGLLITDPAAPPIRTTRDVDAITEVASLNDYHKLSKRLRAAGFTEARGADAPICRWEAASVLLDVMPTNPEILGFGNRWYQPAVETAMRISLPNGRQVRVVAPPYFLATKLGAFDGRGNGDFVLSHDLEDIIAVIDGRPEIVVEVGNADSALRAYLSERFSALVSDDDFLAALPGHLPGDYASQARVGTILARIDQIKNSRRE